MPRVTALRQAQYADIEDFRLHAAVRREARDGKRLEELYHHIIRPDHSDERV